MIETNRKQSRRPLKVQKSKFLKYARDIFVKRLSSAEKKQKGYA